MWVNLVTAAVICKLVLALPFQVEGKTEENESNKRRRKGLFGVFEEVGVQWCSASSLMSTRAEEAVGVGGLGLGLFCAWQERKSQPLFLKP